jgi:hypothetical protein
MAYPNNLTTYRGDTGQQFNQRSGVSNWFSGNPETFRQVPKYGPEIQGDINNLLQQGFQGLQNPYKGFEDIASEATRQYNTQTIPGIAERFAAVPGGQRSSGFEAALGGSGEDFHSSLAAMKHQFGQENRQSMLKQILLGLTNQPEFAHTPKQRGWFEGLLSPFGGGGNYQGASGGQSEGIQMLLKLLPLLL